MEPDRAPRTRSLNTACASRARNGRSRGASRRRAWITDRTNDFERGRTRRRSCRSPHPRDVRFGDRVAIPAGSIVQGSVGSGTRRQGKERALLGIVSTRSCWLTVRRLGIKTDSVVREGASPANESAARSAARGWWRHPRRNSRGRQGPRSLAAASVQPWNRSNDGRRAKSGCAACGDDSVIAVQQPVTVTVENKPQASATGRGHSNRRRMIGFF